MSESMNEDMDETAIILRLLVTSGVSCSFLVGGVVAANSCFRAARRMLRVWMLGGVTNLDRALGDCTMCQHGMEAGDFVRKLSCGHVFHKDCSSNIDRWLRDNDLACPLCRKTVRSVRVLPWKAQPSPETESASSSSQTRVGLAPEETDLEGQHQSPPAPSLEEQQPPPPSSLAGTSDSDSEDSLLPPSASL